MAAIGRGTAPARNSAGRRRNFFPCRNTLALRLCSAAPCLILLPVAGAASRSTRPGCAKSACPCWLLQRLHGSIHSVAARSLLSLAPIPSPSVSIALERTGLLPSRELAKAPSANIRCTNMISFALSACAQRERERERERARRRRQRRQLRQRRRRSAALLSSFFDLTLFFLSPSPKPNPLIHHQQQTATLLRRQDRLGPGLRERPSSPRGTRRPQARHRRPRPEVHDRRLRRRRLSGLFRACRARQTRLPHRLHEHRG